MRDCTALKNISVNITEQRTFIIPSVIFLAGSEICMLVLGNTSIFKDIFALCRTKCHFNLAFQMLAWQNGMMKLIVMQFSYVLIWDQSGGLTFFYVFLSFLICIRQIMVLLAAGIPIKVTVIFCHLHYSLLSNSFGTRWRKKDKLGTESQTTLDFVKFCLGQPTTLLLPLPNQLFWHAPLQKLQCLTQPRKTLLSQILNLIAFLPWT